jgi:uncharacterized protein YkwD
MVLASLPKPSPTVTVKKRHGQHHKVSKQYSKTYWPYLPMLLIVAIGIAVNALWSSPSHVLNYATGVDVTSLLQGTNDQRTAQGLGALALNNVLNKAAQAKANDMAARNYWAHVTPDGKQPWQFMTSAGYSYALAGENLAYGFDTSAEAVAGWMNSPGHRANILKAGYQDVGFGIANSPDFQGDGQQTIIVAMYASPAAAPSATPKAAPVAKAPVATKPAPVTTPAPTSTPEPTASAVPATQPTTPTPTPTPAKTTTTPVANPADTQNLTSQPVSRIDVMTEGNAQWAVLTVSVLFTLGAITLVYRHGKMWRRYLVEGEHFLIKHPLYDIFLVLAIVVSVLLSRTSGFIH